MKNSNELNISTFEFVTANVDARGRVISRRKESSNRFIEDLGGISLEMIEIWGGEFLMGSSIEEGDDDERPQHIVNIPSFFLARFPITQKQWRKVAAWPQIDRELLPAPSCFEGDDLPVEQVGWHEAMEFTARLAKQTGRPYRLPSESEWEYACRAGAKSPFSFGQTLSPKIANFDGSAPYGGAPRGEYRNHTLPVGSLGVANGFGLSDMHGNIWEWCLDSWHADYQGAPTDGSPWEPNSDSPLRVLRGGSWDYPAYGCRSAFRDRGTATVRSPFNGLRVLFRC